MSTLVHRPTIAPGRRGVVLVAVVAALVVAVLGVGAGRLLPRASTPLAGDELPPAVALPPLSLERQDGGRFGTADFRGRVSLLAFGYTHCPDVCPLTLARLAQARRLLGPDAEGVDTYFVTVDPARDTATRLGEYMASFPGVTALRGGGDEQAAALTAFGAVAQRREGTSFADYAMDHTALVYLIDPDAQLRALYQYPADAPSLVADARRILAEVPIRTSGAWARAAAGGGTSAVYVALKNTRRSDDALVGAESPVAGRVEVHRTTIDGGVMRMRPAGDVPVAARSTVKMEPGGLHVMLLDLKGDLAPGQRIPVTLRFASAGDVSVRAVVQPAG